MPGVRSHRCPRRLSCRPMKNTISGNPAKAMMKLVVAAGSDQVLGVHMVGPECAEIMQACPVLPTPSRVCVLPSGQNSCADIDYDPTCSSKTSFN